MFSHILFSLTAPMPPRISGLRLCAFFKDCTIHQTVNPKAAEGEQVTEKQEGSDLLRIPGFENCFSLNNTISFGLEGV